VPPPSPAALRPPLSPVSELEFEPWRPGSGSFPAAVGSSRPRSDRHRRSRSGSPGGAGRRQRGLLPPPPSAPPAASPGAPPPPGSSPLREAEEQDGRCGWPPASLHDGGRLLGDLDDRPFRRAPSLLSVHLLLASSLPPIWSFRLCARTADPLLRPCEVGSAGA
jgi:hypothetical protein